MGAGLLAVKSGFILFIKNYQFPLQINTLEREREAMEEGKVTAAGGRGADQRRRGLDLSCSDVSVGLLWCMFTAFLALPYCYFYTFGKI